MTQLKKCAKDINRYLSREDILMTSKYMKIHLVSVIRMMRIKTTIRYQFTPTWMAVI